MQSTQDTNNYHVAAVTRQLLTDASNGTVNAQLAIEAELQMLLGIVDTD
jgi:hypothetical protein